MFWREGDEGREEERATENYHIPATFPYPLSPSPSIHREKFFIGINKIM